MFFFFLFFFFFFFFFIYTVLLYFFFFFQAEDGIRDVAVTGVQTLLFRSRARPSRKSCRSMMPASSNSFTVRYTVEIEILSSTATQRRYNSSTSGWSSASASTRAAYDK